MHFNWLKTASDFLAKKRITISVLCITGSMFLLGSTSTNVFAIDDTNNVETSNVADNNTDSSKSVEEATEESDKEPDTSDIPKQIVDEGIVDHGLTGTAPWYLTEKGTFYLLDGTMSEYTEADSFINIYDTHKDIKKIDTSLATNSVIAPKNSTSLFSINIESGIQSKSGIQIMDLSKLDTSNVTIMQGMFSFCLKLTELDLSNFDTSNVTNMRAMFCLMPQLRYLDISSFNMSNVTDDLAMFDDACLISIKLGPKNKFIHASLPIVNKNYPNWVNVGDGTEENPQADIVLKEGTITEIPNEPEQFVTQGIVSSTLNIPSNLGDQTITVKGIPGTNFSVNSPQIKNYTVEPTRINVVLDEDEKATTSDTITYLRDYFDNGIATFDTPIGEKTLTGIKGKIGETVNVNVPEINGYTSNKKVVTGVMQPNGTVKLDEKVIYTKNSSSSGSNNSNNSNNNSQNDKPTTRNLEQTVATFANNKYVNLYSFNQSNNKLTKVSNRALGSDTDWFSDKKLTIDDTNYLRVASNEWVKADQVYRFIDNISQVRTSPSNEQEYKTLKDAQNQLITNRSLANNTNWFTDRIAYLGKNANIIPKEQNTFESKFYRVSSNEFINASDVSEY
jgi:surface protein